MIDQFGVVKGSYDPVPLPQIKAHTVRGRPGGTAAQRSCTCACTPHRRRSTAHSLTAWGPLPAPQVRCKAAGAPKDVLEAGTEPIPAALEWGEVLLSIRYAPINPADLCVCGVWGGGWGWRCKGTSFAAGRKEPGAQFAVTY